MAGEAPGTVGALNIKIAIDTGTLNSGIEKARERIAYLDGKLRELSATAGKGTKDAIAQLQKQLKALSDQASASGAKMTYGLGKQISGIESAMNKLSSAAGGTDKTTGNLGHKVQQASYQFQDFAVQVAGGTSALTALGQQGTQLLSIFGAGGAVAGAVLAISTAIAGVAMRSVDAAKGLDELREAALRIANVRFGQLTEGADAIDKLMNAADRDAVKKLDQEIYQAAKRAETLAAQMEATRKELQAAQDAQASAWTDRGAANAQKEAQALREKLNETEQQAIIATRELSALEAQRAEIIDRNTKLLDEKAKAEEKHAEVIAKIAQGRGSFEGGSIFGAVGTEAYAMQLEQQSEFLAEYVRNHEDAERMRAEASERYAKYRAMVEQRTADAGMKALSNLASLMQSKNREMFEVGKAAAIAETVINTYKAATGAYSAMAGIPYVGPALGVAAAAAAVAAGVANVQKISSTQFGSKSAASQGSASYGQGVGSAQTVTQTQTQIASIQIVGSENSTFSRDQVVGLIGAINDAVGDGVQLRTGG